MVAERLKKIDLAQIIRLWRHIIKHLYGYLVYTPL